MQKFKTYSRKIFKTVDHKLQLSFGPRTNRNYFAEIDTSTEQLVNSAVLGRISFDDFIRLIREDWDAEKIYIVHFVQNILPFKPEFSMPIWKCKNVLYVVSLFT